MSRREIRVPLDGLTKEQLAILRELTDDLLIARAEDLRPIRDGDDLDRETGEVAALGRLGFALRHGEVIVPDRTVTELVARRSTETVQLDEARETYERELAEHEAWVALLGHLARGRRGTGATG